MALFYKAAKSTSRHSAQKQNHPLSISQPSNLNPIIKHFFNTIVKNKYKGFVLAEALARKYRPSTFSELIGQEAVSKTLSLALDGSKLSHAYLFSGIRGSGKTSTARIFAKALLCENGPTSQPCQSCEQCVMANEGRHIDIIEMDAASNRGIEDIKELIEHTKYKPSIGRFKVFIIDEVHMLTTAAFNALLKTLEEPPEFIKFILATTDPLKLPATILSRTQHFRFKKLPIKTVSEHLEFILNKEGVDFEHEALDILARSGQGSLRDSLTLLDQAIVYADGKVDTKTVTNMLGIVDPNTLSSLVDSILNKDKEAILNFIQKYAEFEAEMIIDELTLYLQDELINSKGRLSVLLIDRFFRILADGKNLLSIGSNSEFVLTLTLFKMVESLNIHDIDDMINKLQNELNSSTAVSKSAAVTAPSAKRESVTQNERTASITQNIQKQSQEPQTAAEKKVQKPIQNITAQNSGELIFKTLIEKIYDRNYELGEVFERNIHFISFENGKLTWESEAEGEDKKRLIKGWNVIKLFVQELFGINTEIESKKKLNSPAKEENIKETKEIQSASQPQTNSCIMPPGDSEASIDKDPKELLNEPMIQEFIKFLEPKRVIVKQKT